MNQSQNMNEFDVPRPPINKRASMFNSSLSKGKTPTQKKVWTVIIAFFLLSLIVCIVWFIKKPTHWGFTEDVSTNEMGINGFYYWATVTSTVGFGDICPKTLTAKFITALYQMVVAGVSFGLILKITDDHLTVKKDAK